jgi:Aerotolerance regulator N-terminal
MIGGLPLGFAEPLVLVGLLALPVLWWLLRLIPPRPRRIDFPPTRLLLEIAPKEETPARTPWWLTLMRLTLAALIIVAAAGPLWNPPLATSKTRAPIAILIDDGWPAAATWEARLRTADDVIARAENDHRAVALVPLSQGPRDISFATAGSARVRLHQIKPQPYTVARIEALPAIARFLNEARDVELMWLCDGIDIGGGADFVKDLAPMLGTHPLTVVTGGIAAPRALNAADNAAGALNVKVLRVSAGTAETGTVRGLDLKRIARPAPASTCRSKSATTSPVSRLLANAPPAPCNSSTSAGAGAPSVLSPAPRPTPRSRFCRRAITSPVR